MSSLSGFSVPKDERYFEDYQAGSVYEFPETLAVSEEDIIRFALEFDPQYFHTDPAAAAKSIYKGLIASGGHSIALAFRLFIPNFLPGKASCGSPGMDEIRWLKPVRPKDVLRVRVTILEARTLQSRQDRGAVATFVETINQNDETVMTFKAMNFIARRP
ncbi:MAG: MaoC family dehydratase [Deltaproteobacteria bacterium]|jgi:acyl dehydratase|nr:MaoC family dehydratase [Deltaproteobacteria bacterium]